MYTEYEKGMNIKMKKNKVTFFTMLTLCFCLVSNSSITVLAANDIAPEAYVRYSIEDENDDILTDAVLISSDTYIKDGRQISVNIYELPDGTIIKDTLDISAFAQYSSEGSDTVTRKREISQWGSVTITASFQWYTEGFFSYVKCSSMTSSYSINSQVIVTKWEESYTKDYVSIGKAEAKVAYKFVNSIIPTQFIDKTFKITCTDSGTISDNN